MTLNTREKRALGWLAVLAYGWVPGPGLLPADGDKDAARFVGLAALAAEAWGWWTDRQLMQNPDTMNGYFKTGGALSGARSDTQARILRGGV